MNIEMKELVKKYHPRLSDISAEKVANFLSLTLPNPQTDELGMTEGIIKDLGEDFVYDLLEKGK